MIGLVVPFAIVNFPLSLSHSSKCIFFLRDSVIVVRLQSTVFFKQVLIDFLESFLFHEDSASVRLQMVVVIITEGEAGVRREFSRDE